MAGGFQAGSAWIPVRPDFKGFHKAIATEFQKATPAVRTFGQQMGQEFAASFQRGMRNDLISAPLSRDARRQQGAAVGDGARIGANLRRGIETALSGMGDVRIGVDADTTGARAQLSAVSSQAQALDAQSVDIRVGVDTAAATSGLLAMSVAAAGVASIPIGATLGAGLISLLGPLSAATAGFGALAAVAIPSIGRIGEALKAQEQAAKVAAPATAQVGQSAAQAAIQQMQLANAQQAVARAQEQAAERHAQALERVRDAERGVADAQRQAKSAQEDLNRARAEARRDIEDLRMQVKRAELDQEQAVLDVQRAQEALADARRNSQGGVDPRTGAALAPTASAEDVKRAELGVRQAKQRQEEQALALKRLRSEQAAADRQGVDGSDRVRRAREQLAQANRRVADQERNLVKARQDVAKTDRESARAVEQARQQLKMMQLQQQATAASAGAGSAAAVAYADAMADLSPAARGLMQDWLSLTGAFDEWQRALEPKVLPIFGGALRMIEGNLNSLTPVVYGAAGAVGILLGDLQRALSGEWWQGFGERFAASVGPSTLSLGRSLGNVGTGFAGIVNAFLPYAPAILSTLESMTANFAEWGKGLDGSAGFESFMGYVAENAPVVMDFFGSLGDAVVNVTEALAPLGPIALGGFSALLSIVADLPPPVLTALAVAITSVVLATKAWALGSMLFGKSAPLAQKGIKGIGLSLKAAFLSNPVGIIITAITSLIPLVMWAWSELDWFRNGVTKIWKSISGGAGEMWDKHLKPVWETFVGYVQTVIWPLVQRLWTEVFQPAFTAIGKVVGWVFTNILVPVFKLYVAYVQNILVPVVIWLWQNILAPAFRGIAAVISWAWETIIKPTIAMLVWYFQNVVAPAAMWLWKKVLQPAWKGISLAIKIAWGIIKIIFAAIKWTFQKVLAPIFLWFHRTIVKPVWDRIKGAIQTVWGYIRDKVFSPMRSGTGKLGEAFQTARKVIAKAWDGIKKAARAPVKFLVESVYMGGIKPMWDKVADIVGADKLPDVKLPRGFATGGVLPGYTPGRDVHHFVSPTGGRLALSGGETIFRPEVTRALGVRRVNAINRAARTGGVQGVARALGGGQAFANGGIFGGSTSGVRMPNITDLLVDLVAKGAEAFAGIGTWESALNVVFDPVREQLGKIGKTGLQGIPYMASGKIRDKLADWLGDNGVGGGDGSMAGISNIKGLPGAVLRIARSSVGRFPESGGNNRNAITSWYGMPGAPWCAMFISWLFAQARASGSLGRARRTAWTGDYYTSGMRRVANRQPGDVLVYGTRHVNLSLGGRATIGGNESNNVRYSPAYPGSPAIFRPHWQQNTRGGYARGGVVGRDMMGLPMLRRIGRQDDRNGALVPRFASGGWVRGLPGDRNLLLAQDREFIVRARPAKQNAGLLEALNSGRSLRDILAASGHAGASAAQQRVLASLAASSERPGSTVNANVHLHNGEATVRQAFREIRHEMRRTELAGKYDRR